MHLSDKLKSVTLYVWKQGLIKVASIVAEFCRWSPLWKEVSGEIILWEFELEENYISKDQIWTVRFNLACAKKKSRLDNANLLIRKVTRNLLFNKSLLLSIYVLIFCNSVYCYFLWCLYCSACSAQIDLNLSVLLW